LAESARAYARSLTSILLEANVVRPEQVDAGLIQQRSTGLRIGETLVEMGAATEVDIGWALARQLDLPFVDLRADALDRQLVQSFPEGLLHRLDAVPLVNEGPTLSMALADPTDRDLVHELESAAGRPLTLAVATPSSIRSVLREILGPRRDVHSIRPQPAPSNAHFDVEWDRSGATFLQFYIREALRAGASEVHFLARRGSLDVHQRLGRQLVRVGSEPPGALYYLLARIEALGGPVIDDRLTHVAGRIVCPVASEAVDVGVSLLSQEEGVSVTLELRPVPMRLPKLEDLGLDAVDIAVLREALEAPAGLGIVTGPPRVGGSTTLACLLAETEMPGRRCLAFGVAASRASAEAIVPVSIADAARIWAEVAVAQCADVVALDGVLPGTAVSAALSAEAAGRLVLLRTDWTDTFALLEQLATRAQDRAALAERLCFVIQQRLLRVEGEARPANDLALRRDRVAMFEVLAANASLKAGLRAGEPASRLRARAEEDGMRPLTARLNALVASGRVTETEAARRLA